MRSSWLFALGLLMASGCVGPGRSAGSSGSSSGVGGTSGSGSQAATGSAGATSAGAAGAGAGATGSGSTGPMGVAGQGPGGACLASPAATMACTGGVTGPMTGAVSGATSCWGPGTVTLPSAGVSVPAGVTLTINPGTTVTNSVGTVSGPIVVTGGTLNAMGAASAPVKLFGTSLQLTGGSHTIQYAIVNSQSAIAIDVNAAMVAISHMQIQSYTATGLNVHGANAKVTLDFSTIGTTTTLFSTGAGGAPSLAAVAVAIDAAASTGGSSITNSSLGFLQDALNNGLAEAGDTSNLHLAYDFISGTQNTIVTTDKTGVFNAAPGIADIPNLNHNLGPFAPALDLADPAAAYSREPAPNGGRANIGYYGGTECAQPTTVQIVSPNGCETYPAASMQSVTWHASPDTPPPGSKTLSFSSDGGTTWTTLASVPAGADPGMATVTLPNVMSDQCLLRYSQDNDPTHIVSVTPRVFAVGKAANAVVCAVPIRCASGTKTCKYFKAICYEGYRDGQSPGIEPTCPEVQQDLMILEPYTHGIRTYSSDPTLHDGKCIPGIADQLGLEFHMGVWVDSTYTDMANYATIDASVGIVCGTPSANGCPQGPSMHPSIKTFIVGNEYLLRVRQNFGDTTAEEARLVAYIKYARARVPSSIEVVAAESYPDWLTASPALYDAVDRIIWHSHPWWEQIAIADAASHFATTHQEVLAKMAAYGIGKPERCGETGWPWAIDNGAAQGSEANEGQYLHDLNAYSVTSGLEYWFFEGFDEAWKNSEGPVGGEWGMWTSDRTAPPHLVITNLATEIPATSMWP